MPDNPTIRFPAQQEVIVVDEEIPAPAADEVLIRTSRSLVSTGTELAVLEGKLGDGWGELPFTPGYDNVGTVVETGENVTDLREGDRVGTYESHARFVTAQADACRPIPDGVSDDEAVFFTIAEIVMNGVRRGEVSWGETVAVFGLGLLGQLAARFCSIAGARPIMAFDVSATRISHLPDHSWIESVNPADADVEHAVQMRADGRLADVVFEVTGVPEVIPGEFDALREQGRFVVLSSPRGVTEFNFRDLCNAPSYHIIGAHNRSHPPAVTPATPWTQHRHAQLFFRYLEEGALSVDSLITDRHTVSDAPTVYSELLADRTQALGVVFEW